MERVCGNYYVTAFKHAQAKDKKKKDGKDGEAEDDDEGPEQKKLVADSAKEHPLPSALGPLAPRRVSFLSKTYKELKMRMGS